MEARDLIERVPNPADRRSSLLRLRPEGERIHEETWPLVIETVVKFFSPLAEEAQVEFEEMLQALRDCAATDLGFDVEKLDFASRHRERDPEMWTQAQAIRDNFAPRR